MLVSILHITEVQYGLKHWHVSEKCNGFKGALCSFVEGITTLKR